VDRYFKCCAVEVDVRDLATIAATLASAGRNPVTGQRAASEGTVRSVLSVMATCGMYDGAGEWFHTVGLPAKSGVSGGILAVLPGQMGLAVWSPRLDARGNSVRGLAVFKDLSRTLGLHLVGAAQAHVDPVRSAASVSTRHSKRVRTADQRSHLIAGGRSSLLLELQGNSTSGPWRSSSGRSSPTARRTRWSWTSTGWTAWTCGRRPSWPTSRCPWVAPSSPRSRGRVRRVMRRPSMPSMPSCWPRAGSPVRASKRSRIVGVAFRS